MPEAGPAPLQRAGPRFSPCPSGTLRLPLQQAGLASEFGHYYLRPLRQNSQLVTQVQDGIAGANILAVAQGPQCAFGRDADLGKAQQRLAGL